MGEVVNLNRYRKQQEQKLRAARAAANRTRFGRAKDEMSKDRDRVDRARQELDGKFLDDPA